MKHNTRVMRDVAVGSWLLIQKRMQEIASAYDRGQWPTIAETYAFRIVGDTVQVLEHLSRTDGYSRFEFPLDWVFDDNWEALVAEKCLELKEERRTHEKYIHDLRVQRERQRIQSGHRP